MEAQKFEHGEEIQVGGLNTTSAQTVAADTSTTAWAANKIVEVTDVAGQGAWFLIGDSGATIAPAADSGRYVAPGGSTRPFILAAGKVIEATAKINVCTLDIEV